MGRLEDAAVLYFKGCGEDFTMGGCTSIPELLVRLGDADGARAFLLYSAYCLEYRAPSCWSEYRSMTRANSPAAPPPLPPAPPPAAAPTPAPAAPVTAPPPPPPPAATYEWAATNVAHAERVQLGGTPYGPDVVMNAAPYTASHNVVAYQVGIPATYVYRLDALVAAAEPRAVTVTVNGVVTTTNAFAGTSGSWQQSSAQWMSGGEVTMRSGINILRLERRPYFPHLIRIRLTPVRPAP
jgi:hypothetical protein